MTRAASQMNRAASQSSDRGRRRNGWSLEDVQHIVLDNVSWELYEHLLQEVGDRPIRLTYDSGDLEIISPLPEHEDVSRILCFMILELALAMNRPARVLGSTTFRRKMLKRGLEPDECFYIQSVARIRGKRTLTLPKDPPPDLAVEVDITRRSLHRMPIYAALGVPEVWCYGGGRLKCFVLDESGNYVESTYSRAFPGVRPSDLTRFVKLALAKDHTAAVKAFRQWLRRQKWV
jgi:Uma2 family endonuclease